MQLNLAILDRSSVNNVISFKCEELSYTADNEVPEMRFGVDKPTVELTEIHMGQHGIRSCRDLE